jgi:dTDP-L-rhamnose 4-epimerase
VSDRLRVLVTGGAGFVGSHVVDALLEAGHEVVALDVLLPSAHDGKPSYLNPRAEWRFADLRDPDAVAESVRGVDAVDHQAGMVGLGVDLGDITSYVAHNDLGTAELLRALHLAGFAGPIVLASSMVVYGEGRYRCARDDIVTPGPRAIGDIEAGRFDPPCPRCGRALTPEAVHEEAAIDPRNVYAATKVHQEHLVGAYAREHGSPATALRYHNVYGPRMPRDTPYAGVASIFRSALASGRAPQVLEDGRQMRNFVHVRDVARANVLAIERPIPGAFNIASMQPRTVGAMAEALADAFGPDAPRPQVVGGARLGDVRHVFASPEKAQRELGFEAVIGFAEGMREFATTPLRSSALGRRMAAS